MKRPAWWKSSGKGKEMVDSPERQAVPEPRHDFASDVDHRATIVAEAKLLVDELDKYLELIGEWYAEGWEETDV